MPPDAHALLDDAHYLQLALQQAQLAAQGASNPLVIVTNPSQSQSGVIGSLRADLEYALTHDLALGAMLRYDRAADWNEARAGVFVRYRLPE